jgi:hypothetical protein
LARLLNVPKKTILEVFLGFLWCSGVTPTGKEAKPMHRDLTKTPEQKRLDALEREACRFAAHMTALLCREGNRAGRLAKLQRVNARAHKRADRRFKASL